MKILCHGAAHALAFTLCLLSAAPAMASNQERANAKYQQMLTISEEMRDADRSIRETLAEAEKNLTAADYQELLKIHELWVKNDFSANVKGYMESGLKEAEAWAMEIGSHADSIAQAVEVLYLRRHGTGCEGVYEFSQSTPTLIHQGILLVRQADDSYSVTLDVTQGKPNASETCNFTGDGELKGNTLHVSTEEDPEARLTILIEGATARVAATRAANAACSQGTTLDGVYKK